MIDSPPPADDALLFFREMVGPTVAEFMAYLADKRRGCLACLAIDSMIAHYFHARPEHAALGVYGLKHEICGENRVVGIIADIANATKHVTRDGPAKLGYSDVGTHELGRVGTTLRAGWPIAGHEVLVGSDRLVTLVKLAMAYWEEKLGIAPAPGAVDQAD